MSVFLGQFNWDQGLIWQVGFIDGALTPDVAMAENRFHVCPVLVDTGASRTCIAKPVVDALGLQPFGKAEMQTASGLVGVNMYNVHIGFCYDIRQNPDGSQSAQAEFISQTLKTQVLEFVAGDSDFQGLIGRDILRCGVLTLSMDGHYSFSY